MKLPSLNRTPAVASLPTVPDRAPGLPPADYPAGTRWADSGPWYVPEHLRAYFTDKPLDGGLEGGYWNNGCEWTETLDEADIRWWEQNPPKVKLHRLEGAADYPKWRHMERLARAQRDHQRAERQAQAEARTRATWLTCPGCGERSPEVVVLAIPGVDVNARPAVPACPRCRLVVEESVRVHAVRLAGSRRRPDGRTAAEAAEDYAAHVLGIPPEAEAG